MSNPFTQIPASARKWLYLAYGVVGLVLGALQVADVENVAGLSTDKALQVLAYVGLALGFTAASNISTIRDDEVQSYTDKGTPTGVVAGPAAELPTGTPVQPPKDADFILGKA